METQTVLETMFSSLYPTFYLLFVSLWSLSTLSKSSLLSFSQILYWFHCTWCTALKMTTICSDIISWWKQEILMHMIFHINLFKIKFSFNMDEIQNSIRYLFKNRHHLLQPSLLRIPIPEKSTKFIYLSFYFFSIQATQFTNNTCFTCCSRSLCSSIDSTTPLPAVGG